VLQSCILYRFFVTSSSHYSLVQYSPLIVHKCSETATCSNISNQAVATVLHGSVHFLSRTS
jgi:putative component of membrane protein insertase Oxa1/YidC/SpoIIIJ protein YidD